MSGVDRWVPGLGGFHRWYGPGVVRALVTSARIGLDGWGGPGQAVGALGELAGAVFGERWGGVQVSSNVVQCVDLLPW